MYQILHRRTTPMKVLLAGGAGYIGSHTAIEIAKLGHDIVIADDFSNSRPEAVNRILAAYHCEASEAIVVGDTTYDIQMGRNAGTRTCGVTYGNGSRESLNDADWVIDDFGDLLILAE